MQSFVTNGLHQNLKRIALFLPSLQGGGAERVMVTLANEFARRGFIVDLILAVAEGPYLSLVTDKVTIHDLRVSRVVKAFFPLIKYLRGYHPDALLSFMSHANLIAILAGKLSLTGVRVVVSEHSFITGEHFIAKGFGKRTVFELIPILYPMAHGVCSVSKGASQDLERFAHKRHGFVKTIYNPFDLDRIINLSEETLSHPWFDSKEIPLILAAGRLNEAKSFHILIEAFHILKKYKPARLMILGEGELRLDLESLAARLNLGSSDFQMPGFVSNPYAWMAACSVFVLSSCREALPGVLIEAMACGAPIVSTDCDSGPREILADGKFGKLVPVGDANALANAIKEVLDTDLSKLPAVRFRSQDFNKKIATDSYLEILGFPQFARNTI